MGKVSSLFKSIHSSILFAWNIVGAVRDEPLMIGGVGSGKSRKMNLPPSLPPGKTHQPVGQEKNSTQILTHIQGTSKVYLCRLYRCEGWTVNGDDVPIHVSTIKCRSADQEGGVHVSTSGDLPTRKGGSTCVYKCRSADRVGGGLLVEHPMWPPR